MEEKEKKKINEEGKKGQISRREFLKDAGLVVGGATIGSMAFLNACGKTTTETVTTTKTNTTTVTSPAGGTSTVTVTAPGTTSTVTVTATPPAAATNMVTVSFTVNGQKYTPTVDPSWDLQYLLHDVMGFLEIKTFCYRGACGSCTIIMDGRPVLSCMTLAVNADGHTIQTSNGIAVSGHPLYTTYIANSCMQCGYCTPGFLCTSKALLDRNPSPSDTDIMEALSGNLCRCGTYPQHILAVNAAAVLLKQKGGS